MSSLGWEEEDGAGRPAQRRGERSCPKQLMNCRQVWRSLARVRNWDSLLWMLMAEPAGLTFMAAQIHCWVLMLP